MDGDVLLELRHRWSDGTTHLRFHLVRVPAGARDHLERICRYALRPPVAQDRIRLTVAIGYDRERLGLKVPAT